MEQLVKPVIVPAKLALRVLPFAKHVLIITTIPPVMNVFNVRLLAKIVLNQPLNVYPAHLIPTIYRTMSV